MNGHLRSSARGNLTPGDFIPNVVLEVLDLPRYFQALNDKTDQDCCNVWNQHKNSQERRTTTSLVLTIPIEEINC
jgi:hypothetical protein